MAKTAPDEADRRRAWRSARSRPNPEDDQVHLNVHPVLLDACLQALVNIDGGRLRQIAVTSAVRGEGRSSVAAALAMIQANDYGRRTLLIEADFERPSFLTRFGLDAGPGLAELLRGTVDVVGAVRSIGDGIDVMTAGHPVQVGPRLANDLAASNLTDELGAEFDCQIIDLPPLLGSKIGPLLAGRFGTPLLVVKAQSTSTGDLRQALFGLETSPHIILNGVHSALPRWLQRILDGR